MLSCCSLCRLASICHGCVQVVGMTNKLICFCWYFLHLVYYTGIIINNYTLGFTEIFVFGYFCLESVPYWQSWVLSQRVSCTSVMIRLCTEYTIWCNTQYCTELTILILEEYCSTVVLFVLFGSCWRRGHHLFCLLENDTTPFSIKRFRKKVWK